MRRAFTAPTYTNSPVPPNIHTTELRLASDNAPQQHYDGGINYTFGKNRIMTTNKKPQTHAHLCNWKDVDPQPHTHGQYHLPQQNTNMPLVLETDPAIRQDAKQDGITYTTPSGPTLAIPTTSNRNLLAPPTT